jgi:rhodanese-related sulfurtransferase
LSAVVETLEVQGPTEHSGLLLANEQWESAHSLKPIGEVAPSTDTSLLVTCKNGIDSTLAAATLMDHGYGDVLMVDGGTDGWRRGGFVLETGLTGVFTAPNDVLPVSRSYAEMLNYLRWEEDLGQKYVI